MAEADDFDYDSDSEDNINYNINYKSISCETIPELFYDKLVVKKHFSKFGKINRFILRSNCCTVDYETEEDAANAYKNAGNFNGKEFLVNYAEKQLGHVKNTEKKIKNKRCEPCGKSFATVREYNRHTINVHRSIKCPFCPYEQKRLNLLRDHIGLHSNVCQHQCEICGLLFKHRRLLTKHRNRQHTPNYVEPKPRPKSETCPNCDSQFHYLGNLIKHKERCLGPTLKQEKPDDVGEFSNDIVLGSGAPDLVPEESTATTGTIQDVVLQQRPSNQSPTIVSMSTMEQNVTPVQFQAAAQLRLASRGKQQVVTKGIPVSSLQQAGKITTTGGNQPAQIQLYRHRQQLKVLQSGQGGQTVVQTANGQTALVNSADTIIQGGSVQTTGVATIPAGNVANSSGCVVTSVATVQVAHNQGRAQFSSAGQHQGTVNLPLSHLKPSGQIKVTMVNQSQKRQLHMQQHLAVAQPSKISKMTQLAAAQANAASNQQQISNQPLTQSTVGGATSVQKSTSSGGVKTQLVHIQNTKSLPGSVTVQQNQQVMRQGQQGTLSATGLVLGKTSVGRVIPVSVASQPNQRQTIQVVSAVSAQAIAAGNIRAHVAGGQNISGTIKIASAGAGEGQTQQAPVRLQTTVGGFMPDKGQNDILEVLQSGQGGQTVVQTANGQTALVNSADTIIQGGSVQTTGVATIPAGNVANSSGCVVTSVATVQVAHNQGRAQFSSAGQHQGTVNLPLSPLKPSGQIKVTMVNQSQKRQLHMQQHLAVAQPSKISKMTQLAAAQANAASNQQQISNQPLTQSTVGGATSVQKSTSSGGVKTQLVHIQNTKSLPGSVTVQQNQQVMRQGQQGTLSATGLVLGKTSVGRVIPVSVASQPNQRQTIQVVSAVSAQAIAAGNIRAHVAGGQNISGTIKIASAGAGEGQTQQAPVRLQTTVGGFMPDKGQNDILEVLQSGQGGQTVVQTANGQTALVNSADTIIQGGSVQTTGVATIPAGNVANSSGCVVTSVATVQVAHNQGRAQFSSAGQHQGTVNLPLSPLKPSGQIKVTMVNQSQKRQLHMQQHLAVAQPSKISKMTQLAAAQANAASNQQQISNQPLTQSTVGGATSVQKSTSSGGVKTQLVHIQNTKSLPGSVTVQQNQQVMRQGQQGTLSATGLVLGKTSVGRVIPVSVASQPNQRQTIQVVSAVSAQAIAAGNIRAHVAGGQNISGTIKIASAGAGEGQTQQAPVRLQTTVGGFMPDKGQNDILEITQYYSKSGTNEIAKRTVPFDNKLPLFSFFCFVIPYKYTGKKGDIGNIIYVWQGALASDATRERAWQDSMSLAIEKKAMLVRVPQNHEPRQFLKMFSGRLWTFLSNQCVRPQLFRIRGTDESDVHVLEVPCYFSSLASRDVFALIKEGNLKIQIWIGLRASEFKKQMAQDRFQHYLAWSEMEIFEEGAEPNDFWVDLKGVGIYDRSLTEETPRLFLCRFEIKEISNFKQADLDVDDIMLLDGGDEIYMWVGSGVTADENSKILEIAKKYIQHESTARTIDTVNIIRVAQSEEPKCFKRMFPSWADDYWQIHKDIKLQKSVSVP